MIPTDHPRALLPLATILLILPIAWMGQLDVEAELYIGESIKNAAILYGIARGINAAVSLMQSVDVSVVVASIQLGELLDPINDMIERFSDAMTYAIVSLTMQQILLEIVRAKLFNILLTLSALLYVGLWLGKSQLRTSAFKLFLTLTFLRLSLTAVLLLNMAVDHSFMNAKVAVEQQKMVSMQEDMSHISGQLNNQAQSDSSEEKSWMESAQASLQKVAGSFHIQAMIDDAMRKSEAWFSSILTLLTLVLLKSIILPLLFWYAILKGVKALWAFEIIRTPQVQIA